MTSTSVMRCRTLVTIRNASVKRASWRFSSLLSACHDRARPYDFFPSSTIHRSSAASSSACTVSIRASAAWM